MSHPNDRPRHCSSCGRLIQPDDSEALRGDTYILCNGACDRAMADDLNTRERDDALYDEYRRSS